MKIHKRYTKYVCGVYLFYIQVCSITQPRTKLNDACVGIMTIRTRYEKLEKRTRVPYDTDTRHKMTIRIRQMCIGAQVYIRLTHLVVSSQRLGAIRSRKG